VSEIPEETNTQQFCFKLYNQWAEKPHNTSGIWVLYREVITVVLSFRAFLAPISTTGVLPAVQGIFLELDKTIPIFDISNADLVDRNAIVPVFLGSTG
jgi:hypothetical protein